MVSGLSNFKITVKPDCMFLQQAGEFYVRGKIVRQETVIKEITYGKNKLLMIIDSSDYCKCFPGLHDWRLGTGRYLWHGVGRRIFRGAQRNQKT